MGFSQYESDTPFRSAQGGRSHDDFPYLKKGLPSVDSDNISNLYCIIEMVMNIRKQTYIKIGSQNLECKKINYTYLPNFSVLCTYLSNGIPKSIQPVSIYINLQLIYFHKATYTYILTVNECFIRLHLLIISFCPRLHVDIFTRVKVRLLLLLLSRVSQRDVIQPMTLANNVTFYR